MNFAVYEHPLNEKARILMRLELIFAQLEQTRTVSNSPEIQSFFHALFSCIEILERNDIRQLLTYYLDFFEKNMLRWAEHPNVNNDSLQNKLREAVRLQSHISSMTKACQQLKEDKFLASLRQRFAIPGGACDFDLPQLHYWRFKSTAERLTDVENWFEVLLPLKQALDFSMLFIRESAPFEDKVAEQGFYQDATSENVILLRVKYDPSLGIFPTISGSRHRYAISFMAPDEVSVKSSVNDTIQFQLATC